MPESLAGMYGSLNFGNSSSSRLAAIFLDKTNVRMAFPSGTPAIKKNSKYSFKRKTPDSADFSLSLTTVSGDVSYTEKMKGTLTYSEGGFIFASEMGNALVSLEKKGDVPALKASELSDGMRLCFYGAGYEFVITDAKAKKFELFNINTDEVDYAGTYTYTPKTGSAASLVFTDKLSDAKVEAEIALYFTEISNFGILNAEYKSGGKTGYLSVPDTFTLEVFDSMIALGSSDEKTVSAEVLDFILDAEDDDFTDAALAE